MFATYHSKTADELWLELAAALVSEKAHAQSGRRLPTRELLHVAFSIDDPRQRWVLSRSPALNPAFVLAEVLWILNGNDEAPLLNFWNTRLRQFAGDCNTYHGAYGRRLRSHFGVDQLLRAVSVLRNNPDSRQVVLQIYDPAVDLPNPDGTPADSDIPCNVTSILKVRDGRLEWLQVMRSNDLHLGLPHDLVQFTTLQEILAGWIGVELGPYHQISDSLHVYQDHFDAVADSLRQDRIEIPNNNGQLATSMDDGLAALATLDRAVRILIDPSLQAKRLADVVEGTRLPCDYANWLVLLAAESARRHGWRSLADEISHTCSNPVLTLAWDRWVMRLSSGKLLEAVPSLSA
jgi:thymidylate synthase